MKKCFRSCFIIDVKICNDVIILTDSVNNNYYIDTNNENTIDEFKIWFKNIFKAGVSQTLTIFEYIIKDISECETERHIVKFIK